MATVHAVPPAQEQQETPTDFAYWDTLRRPGVERFRRRAQRFLRFDPFLPDDVAAEYIADMWAGDPVAEAFVDDTVFGELGPRATRKLVDRALEEGVDAVGEAPDSMRTLFAEFERVPEWVDPELVERGAAIWRRWGTDLFAVAGLSTLEIYTEAAVALPLSLTGGYAGDNALRRFLETGKFWVDVSEPGALLTPHSQARKTAMRVRIMHVSVRRRVSEHPEWDAAKWGTPISQLYMLLTLMGGSVAPALFLWGAGYQTGPNDMRALLHYQRYMGYLLGVHPRRYPETVSEAFKLVSMTALARTYTSGDHGKELIESFPNALSAREAKGLRERLRHEYERHLYAGYLALFMQPQTRAKYDLPPVFPSIVLMAARAPVVGAGELARRVIPGVGDLLERRADARRKRWLAGQLQGREAEFQAASALRR
ncbi:MAG: DUF2236 domain-containing protein [Solirubrobacteraceae bacterium]|nr:DUF2236 domain-containing protein [Solirubrobacteraceae bacterium]